MLCSLIALTRLLRFETVIPRRLIPLIFVADLLTGLNGTALASGEPSLSRHLEATDPIDFSLPDAVGTYHRLSTYRGNWVVVNFWATWCGPCVREMPALQKLADDHDQLVLVGVNFEEIDNATLKAAIEKLDVSYLIVRAGDEPVLPFEPLKGLPSTFFVNPSGRLVYRHTGELTYDELVAAYEAIREAQP